MDQARINPEALRLALGVPGSESSDFDLNPGLRPSGAEDLRPASVLVPLIETGSGLNVVLTRRTAFLLHHPGQIALPGGKQDKSDRNACETALREAREEIGLDPEQVQVLGEFDPHETVTGFRVTPFVGLVSPGFRPRADPSEVAEVFEVPARFVLDPANLQVHRRRWQGIWRSYYAMPYGPYYIWGATARILKSLAVRLDTP